MTATPRLASVFIDFENIYYFLRNQEPPMEEISDAIAELIRNLRTHLQTTYAEQVISMDAYADFERIAENAQGVLYLTGVETHNILGTEHKNAADMKLCIDVIEMLHTRQDISTFILFAGDRDYIPVIQHLKKKGKAVRAVGFPKSMSGDLLTIVGSDYFIDATVFLPKAPLPKPPAGKALPPGKPVFPSAKPSAPALPSKSVPADPDYRPYKETEYYGAVIELINTDFKTKPEIWLVPFLHKLREKLPELTEFERKQILTALAMAGGIKIEKRPGAPNDYSVILVNWNSPVIQKYHP